MKNSLAAWCCLLVGLSNCSGPHPPSPLTKAHIRETLRSGGQSPLTLPPGTHAGCVTVPGGFMQRALVGFQFTGEKCSFTISAHNHVRVSFLGATPFPVLSTGPSRYPEDVYVAELENNQVLVVRHNTHGSFITVTQTGYDSHNRAVYRALHETVFSPEAPFPLQIKGGGGQEFHQRPAQDLTGPPLRLINWYYVKLRRLWRSSHQPGGVSKYMPSSERCRSSARA